MRIVLLTGSEIRHEYFRKKISCDSRIEVLASFCEGLEDSLENRIKENDESSDHQLEHVRARTQTEKDFFEHFIRNSEDHSKPKFIPKGSINDKDVVQEIISLCPDLIICYGSSLIKSKLLNLYEQRFVNVHLGLSPYYRGSGTNVWPLINNEPHMVGATFMHIDAGIDTGKIIHQIRADIYLGDSPHTIGNRLIKKMTEVYAEIIINFDKLEDVKQPKAKGKLYLRKDFDSEACRILYKNFSEGMIEKFISSDIEPKYLVKNKVISS